MKPCDQYLDALLAASQCGVVEDLALSAHLQSCDRCRASFARACALSTLLRSLPRKTVPFAMDGAAVASMHAGSREDRVVANLRRLARIIPPPELSKAVRSSVGDESCKAPQVLERLLEEEMADRGRSTARRAGARLQRVAAPPELTARIQAAMAQPSSAPQRKPHFRPILLAAGLLGLAFVLGESFLGHNGVESPAGRRIAAIEFRRAQDVTLDATSRALLDGLSGGAFTCMSYRNEGR